MNEKSNRGGLLWPLFTVLVLLTGFLANAASTTVSVRDETGLVSQPPNFWSSNRLVIEAVLGLSNYLGKATYDTNNNGVIDNAEKLGGLASTSIINRANHTGTQLRSTISDFGHESTHESGGSDALPWSRILGMGLSSDRPSASGNANYLYLNTTSGFVERSDGTNWIVFTNNASFLEGLSSQYYLQRSNHLGTQLKSTISDFGHGSTHLPGGSDALPWVAIHGYGTTANRPAASSTNAGWLYFDTTLSAIQRSDGTNWVTVALSGGGGGATNIDLTGAQAGYFLVVRSNLTIGATGDLSVVNFTVTSNMTVSGQLSVGQRIGLASLDTNILPRTEAVTNFQTASSRLTQLATISYAPGDIIIVDASTNPVRLARGADGLVLKLTSGYPAWGTDNSSSNGVSVQLLDDILDVVTPGAVDNDVLVRQGTNWVNTNKVYSTEFAAKGTNFGQLFIADASATNDPPGVTIRSPDVVPESYTIIIPSNATPGLALLSSLNSTTLVLKPIQTTGVSGNGLIETNVSPGLFFGAVQGKSTNLDDLADGQLTPTKIAYQSGPVNGRPSTFGDYIRSIHANTAVSIPVEPRLLLLAPIGGQSLSTGSGGVTNVFSPTPRHPTYSLMWTQGVHYGEPGTAGVVIASSALTGVTDLFADVVTGPGRAETPIVAAVDYWNAFWSNSFSGIRARVLAATHGLGGAELNAIDEGTASFSNLVAHIQGAASIATASNWVLNIPVWYVVHGENDTYLNTPVENYRTNFLTMYERMNTIAKTASGQSNDPIVIMTQTASRTYENQSNSHPANAQLFLNLSDSRIKVAVPTYIFPTVADGVHLTNSVSAWLGEYLSKAARYELFGLGWNPVMPTNVTVSGTNVVIKYTVPKPPLVFDTNLVSNPGSFGYSLDGATIGTPTVSGNTVTIPFTAGSPTRVKYGWNGSLGAADGPTTGQRGNLRDSDLEVGSLTGSNLYNWGLIFNLPVTVPSTPSSFSAVGGNGKISLSWSRVADAATYTLKRSLVSGGPYTTIKTTTGISFDDVNVSPEVTYYYVVTAKGPSGESSQSVEVIGTATGGSSTITRSWIPTDLGSKLAGWYRASSISVGDGNPIDSWTDESGNGYHLTASSGVRPTQQNVSGRNVVRFDGVDDRLDQTGIGTKFNGIGEANFWTVGRPNSTNVTAGNRNLWYLSRVTNGSVRLSLAQSTTTPGRWRFGGSRVDGDSTDNDDSGTLIDTNSTVILHTKFDFSNGDKFLYTNGVIDTTDTTFASAGVMASENLALYRMGASALAAGGNPTNWYAGDIEMQIITTGIIDTSDQQKIEGYIAHSLGLTNLLASNHPYKTNAPMTTVGSTDLNYVTIGSSVLSSSVISNSVTYPIVTLSPSSATNFTVDLAVGPRQLIVATNDVFLLNFNNLPPSSFSRVITLTVVPSGSSRTFSVRSSGTGTNIYRANNLVGPVTVTNGTVLHLTVEGQLVTGVATNINISGSILQ